ncbi:hypothetical protein PV760_13690 [Paenarthrobacter sp. CC6]|uniref:hypothetical protein n=1 Tax=Paenarthrobacter sp. CC6 TaxID=3029184 RepID=UPI00339D280D
MHKPTPTRTIKTRRVSLSLALAAAALFPALAASPAQAGYPPQSMVTAQETIVTIALHRTAPLLPDSASLSLAEPAESQRGVFSDRRLTQMTTPPSPQPSTASQPAAPESIGPDDGNAPLVAAIVAAILLIAGAGFFFSQRRQRDQS